MIFIFPYPRRFLCVPGKKKNYGRGHTGIYGDKKQKAGDQKHNLSHGYRR